MCVAVRLRAADTADVGARSEEALYDRADSATSMDEGGRDGGGVDGRLRATAAAAAGGVFVVDVVE